MVQTRKLKDGSRQIILNGKQYEGITKVLSELASKTKASAILFADMSGQLISQRGNTENMNTTVLSALAASDFAATAEMAKLVGEEAKYRAKNMAIVAQSQMLDFLCSDDVLKCFSKIS